MKQRKPARKTGRTTRTAKKAAPGRKAVPTRKVASTSKGTRDRKAAPARKAVPARKAAGPIELPTEVAIAAAPELRAGLLKRLTDSAAVQIDASGVQRIDTASLQVLAAFARDRRAEGLPVEWLSVPACVAEAAALLDLTDALGIAAPPAVQA